MRMSDINRLLDALEERARVKTDPRLGMAKEERDAAVRAVLNDPDKVRAIIAGLVGDEHADSRADAFESRRAGTAAAMRADT